MNKYFIFTFLILTFMVYSITHYHKDQVISDYLEEKTEQRYLEYQVIYNNYKTFADFIFKVNINTDTVLNLFEKRDRVGLKKHLDKTYKELRGFNVRQLHFHLPNNDSFLRMHRPNKYGDNLTKARLTVKYVNEHKKFIDGFEEGKIFNGFRFVYPLFKDNKHIGSVEISYSALFFIKRIVNSYKVVSNFFIDKDIVGQKVFNDEKSNYMKSPYDKYFVQKSIMEYLNIDMSKIQLNNDFVSDVYRGIEVGKPFSMLFDKQTDKIVTFIPLKNPITKKSVAVLSVKYDDDFIDRKNFNALMIFLLNIIIIIIGLLLIYRQLKYQL